MIHHENEAFNDIQLALQDPFFHDVNIEATDGEMRVNRTILSMRSQYFRSMFNMDNFEEGRRGESRMPYQKQVLEKVINFLYSGYLDSDNLSLGPLLELLDLLKMLSMDNSVYSAVKDFALRKIDDGGFPLEICVKHLKDAERLLLEEVSEGLISYLQDNLEYVVKGREICSMSENLILQLLLDRGERQTPTITRFRTFATWFSSNDIDSVTKEEILETIEFDDFTTEELATEVKESGLYSTDKIIAKMLENFQLTGKELESKSKELEATLADKEETLKIQEEKKVKWLKPFVMEKKKLEEKNKILNSRINLLQDRTRMLEGTNKILKSRINDLQKQE